MDIRGIRTFVPGWPLKLHQLGSWLDSLVSIDVEKAIHARRISSTRGESESICSFNCSLAQTLQQLTNLRKLHLKHLILGAQEHRKPLVDEISRSAHLLEVKSENLFGWPEPNTTATLGHEELQKLQFGPRLNQAKKEFMSGKTITTSDLVNALISVRDRVDCLDHLLSEVDPTLYAVPAISNLRRRDNSI